MDLTFKRYADPFLFFDTLLNTGQFARGVIEIIRAFNEDSLYDFFLHKVHEQSFADFKRELVENTKNLRVTDHEIEATVKKSQNILQNFTPNSEEGGV